MWFNCLFIENHAGRHTVSSGIWSKGVRIPFALMIRELLTGIAMRKKGIREPFYYHPDILGGNRK